MPKRWTQKPQRKTKAKKYYFKNIPALIAAIIIGIFMTLDHYHNPFF
jgi:hypothetical protein